MRVTCRFVSFAIVNSWLENVKHAEANRVSWTSHAPSSARVDKYCHLVEPALLSDSRRLHGPGGSSERPSMDDAGQDPCYKVSSLRAISASTSPSLSPRTRPTPASAERKHFGRNVATETSRSSQSFPESTQHRAKASQCSSYYAPHNHLCSIANFYVNKNCVYAFHYKWKMECTFCVKNAMCLIPAYCLFVRK